MLGLNNVEMKYLLLGFEFWIIEIVEFIWFINILEVWSGLVYGLAVIRGEDRSCWWERVDCLFVFLFVSLLVFFFKLFL